MAREPTPTWEGEWMRVLVAPGKHIRIVGQGEFSIAALEKLAALIQAQIDVLKDEETPDAG